MGPAVLPGDPVEFSQAALRGRFPTLWDRFGNQFMIGIA